MLAYRLIRETLQSHLAASASTLSLLGVSRVIQACIPILFATLVARFEQQQGTDVALWLLAGYVLASLFVVVADEARLVLFLPLIQRTQQRFLSLALTALHAKTNGFHSRHASPKLTQMMTRAAWSLESLSSVALFNLLPNALFCLIAAIVLGVTQSLAFAAILMLTLFVYVRFTIHMAQKQKALYANRIRTDNDVHAVIGDSLANYEVVQQFDNAASERQRLEERQSLMHRDWQLQQRHLSRSKVIQSLIVHTGLGMMLYLTVRDIQANQAGVADLVLVNMYMLQVFTPLQAVGLLYTAFIQSRSDIQNLEELGLEPARESESTTAAPRTRLSLDQVCVVSPEGETLLDAVSLDIPVGSTVAIIGQSGAGKSMLMKVLGGLIRPDAGTLCYDGKPVDEASRQRHTLYVSQRTGIFDDTLDYNIRFADANCSADRLSEAVQASQLEPVIAQRETGLATPCGEGGELLSGGERQRLALARAWLSHKPILILDEATSQLDRLNESLILENVHQRHASITRFIITHRLDSIVSADWIILLERGRLVAQGSHDTLMEQSTLYRTLRDNQEHPASPSGSRTHAI